MHPLYFKEADFNSDPNEVIRMGFGFVRAPKGAQDYFDYSVSTIAFLISGKVHIWGEDLDPITLEGGHMAAFPTNIHHVIETLEDTTAVFLYVIGDNMSFCESILNSESRDNLPVDDHRLHVQPIVPILQLFSQQIAAYIEDRKFTHDISYIKQQELTALLSSYYSQEQLRDLLAPIYRTGRSFYGKVMGMSNLFLTVESMAKRLNMSRSTFLRRFRETFNESPKCWAIHMKCNLLFKALYYTEEPLISITRRLHFSSQQRMSAFCKVHLGGTPMEIRQGEVKPVRANFIRR